MSNENFEGGTPSRKIVVKVDRSPEQQRLMEELENVKSERDGLQQTLESLALAEFENQKNKLISKYPEKRDVIESIEKPSQLETVEALLSDKPAKKPPAGIVTLEPSSKPKQSALTKPYDNQKFAWEDTFTESRKNLETADKLDEVWRRVSGKPSPKFSISYEARVKSRNNRYVWKTNNTTGFAVMVPERMAKSMPESELQKLVDSGKFG